MKDSDVIKIRTVSLMGGMKNKPFADKCNVSEGVIRKILRGEGAKAETLRKIAEANGKDLAWYYSEPSNVSPAHHPTQKIPIISWVKAGDWAEAMDPFRPGYADDWIDTSATSNINAFALIVHGDSMEPEFCEGDIVTVDPGRAYCSGSYVIAKNGDEATFKQLIIDGSSVFLKPLNERYPIKDMTGIEMRIVGVVVEKRKRY